MPPSQPRRLSDFSECQLVQALTRSFGYSRSSSIVKGIGDDAAIIRSRESHNWLVSTDLLLEDIHFDLRFTSFFDIGYRAAVANLSDIAAMGGTPQYLLVALAIPSHHSMVDLQALYRGLRSPCQLHHVRLIGGDTSASRKGIFISITVIGTVEPNKALQRSGAQIGDYIYTTGTLGDSRAGLEILLTNTKQSKTAIGDRISRFLIKRHLRPTPRIDMGRWLSTHQLATAAIDLSDGLSGDLNHVCQESGVGAQIDETMIPISSQYKAFTRQRGHDPTQMALRGGEDYELLFTVPARYRTKFTRLVKQKNLHITKIGIIQSKKDGIRLKLANGTFRPILVNSYDHFRKN